MDNLRDFQSGISMDAIRGCSDKLQLMQWQEELFMDIADISLQIEKYHLQRKMKEEVDHKWYLRARGALWIKNKLKLMVDNRIEIIRDKQSNFKNFN